MAANSVLSLPVVGEYFGDTQFVLSDVWAALLLLVNREFRVLDARKRRDTLAFSPEPWMTIPLAQRYMQFALGVYGWPYYLCDNFSCKGCCGLLHLLRPFYSCRCDNLIVIKDNACLCNTAALKLETGITDSEIFYLSFHNRVYEVPFVACVDTETRAVVVAIRGSMSLRDALTDLCLHEEPFELPFEPGCTARVHRGILASARYVYGKLDGEKILDDLFILYPDYSLVITGHSLGAGVAAVVSLMLKPKFPHVRCFAFSPPGCVVSEDQIPKTQSFILSIVIGADLVCRLSRHTIEDLKRHIVHAIDECDRPKYDILIKGCYKLFCAPRQQAQRPATASLLDDGAVDDDADVEDGRFVGAPNGGYKATTPDEPLLGASASSSTTGGYHSFENSAVDDEEMITAPRRIEGSNVVSNLRIPGRILHIVEVGREGSGHYRASWSDHTQFQTILLQTSMLADHMPFNVYATLKKVATQRIVDV